MVVHKHEMLVLLGVIYLIDVRLMHSELVMESCIQMQVTDMVDCHQNSYFLHDLFDFAVSFDPDTFAGNLAML